MDESTSQDVEANLTRKDTGGFDGLLDVKGFAHVLNKNFQAIEEYEQQHKRDKEKIIFLEEKANEVAVLQYRHEQKVKELQEELSSLRAQCMGLQGNRKELLRRLNEVETSYDGHLKSIANQHNQKRIVHRAARTWQRKVREHRSGTREIRMLEEENERLKEELITCQEAAKQAFLRSATTLNAEAITLFQDAATRRLNIDVDYSSESEISDAFEPQQNIYADPSNEVDIAASVDEAMPKAVEKQVNKVQMSKSLPYTSRSNPDIYRSLSDDGQSKSEPLQVIQREDQNYCPKDYVRNQPGKPSNAFHYYYPSILRREARSCLRQLREGQLKDAPEFSVKNCSEEAINQQQHNCVHRIGDGLYRCPFCNPGQNSNFRHNQRKVIQLKSNPVKTCNKIEKENIKSPGEKVPLSGYVTKKNVIYKPSASTVVIEKHLNR